MNRIKFITMPFFFAAFLFSGLMIIQTYAAPGDLDTTFGSGGKIIIPADTPPSFVRVQADGKIVTFGDYPYGSTAYISRSNPDGTPDPTFGINGLVLTNNEELYVYFTDFVTLPDGKYLVIGAKDNLPALYRYNSNGTPDTSFGSDGILKNFKVAGFDASCNTIVLQPDGKVIIGGSTVNGSFLARYNTDGTPDATFGVNGVVFSAEDSFGKIVIQPNGKLLVLSGKFGPGAKISRYNADGTKDNGFGIKGSISTGLYYNAGIALQSNGKIVFGGSGFTPKLYIIDRYNQNGTPDPSFGTNGRVEIIDPSTNPYSLGLIRSLVVQKNNKILTAGSLDGIFAVQRFDADGRIDNSFGTNGLVTTQMSSVCRLFDITLQPDGKIVAVGDAASFGNAMQVGLVRYLGDPPEAAPNHTNFDYDGDGQADVSVFRPSNGAWYFNRSQSGFDTVQFGNSTDKLTSADYDGDGKTDIAIFRSGVWAIRKSSNGQNLLTTFGQDGDIPVAGDYDGDGRADIAVFRPSNSVWYILRSSDGVTDFRIFGDGTDKPVPADYDGDGKTDIAVFRASSTAAAVWYWQRSGDRGVTTTVFGSSTDKPVPADYDGDGKADIAIFRSGSWAIRKSSDNTNSFISLGQSEDIPVPADYDGDGRADAAVFRNGAWYLLQSSNGFAVVQFGMANDKPVPAGFLP